MKITLIMVMSVNGKITRGFDSDVTQWTSKEDQQLFADRKAEQTLIVMGSHTYEENIHRIQPTARVLRIVLTKNPQAMKKNTIPGILEFSDETPIQLVGRLEKNGYTSMLLVGGAQINSSFIKAGLLDELHITIEPMLFGEGKNLFAQDQFNSSMELIDIKQLNTKGTLHLRYKINK